MMADSFTSRTDQLSNVPYEAIDSVILSWAGRSEGERENETIAVKKKIIVRLIKFD